MDLNVPTTKPDVEKWGETRFFGAYDADRNTGIYVHAGRFRKDLGVWWVHLAAFLPDGRIVVDRSWGEDVDRAVVRTGAFELTQLDDGFQTIYNGVGQLTSTQALAAGPQGSGADLARLRWSVRFTDFGSCGTSTPGRIRAGSMTSPATRTPSAVTPLRARSPSTARSTR